MKRRWAAVAGAMLAVGLAWCGWRWREVRGDREAMARVEESMRDGHYAVAVRDLSAILERRPGSDRAAYLLGLCEKARGRDGEADAAWARVPVDSPWSGRAVAERMDALVARGRLADAEAMIDREADARGADGSALRMLMIPLLIQEGRAAEADRRIEDRWRHLEARGDGGTEQSINLARLYHELHRDPPPVEALRAELDRAGGLAPDDDRVWLGRANLATRTGAYDDAARWLDACLKKRRDDPAVWRARLDRAMSTRRLAEARVALEHLPADAATPVEVHRLAAGMASICGDVERERRELASAVALDPDDLRSLDRLEAIERGRATGPENPPGLVRDRAEIERARARYEELHRRHQPSRDAAEMAGLAEGLGRRFEAMVYLSAALADEPDRDDLRRALDGLKQAARRPETAGPNLLDRLAIDCGEHGPP